MGPAADGRGDPHGPDASAPPAGAVVPGQEAGEFFQAVSAAARRGEDLGRTWRGAAEALPLSGVSAAALAELGDSLHGDEENVCKVISLAIYSMAQDAEEQTRRQPEEAKRATALCLSGAALLVILLI